MVAHAFFDTVGPRMASIIGKQNKNWGVVPRTIERKIFCGFKFWPLANMHAGVIYAASGCWRNSKQKKYLVGVG